MRKLFFLLLPLFLLSCSDSDDDNDYNPFIGNWITQNGEYKIQFIDYKTVKITNQYIKHNGEMNIYKKDVTYDKSGESYFFFCKWKVGDIDFTIEGQYDDEYETIFSYETYTYPGDRMSTSRTYLKE